MPLLPSASPRLATALAARRAPRVTRPVFPYQPVVRISLWLSVFVVVGLFGWGSWQRRWIADDGLIVLRTVRNLLAGNGPVFNQGERVEANTSTAWTYLMYAGSWVGGPLRMEYVALTLALMLSLLGVALLMLGAGRLYAPSLRGRRAIMLPAGALVYIALPPSRDFATSGLESGLALAYLGLLWWMMVCWSQPLRTRSDSRLFLAALAFVAGFSVLVRPELALMGGLALIMMLIAARTWRNRVLIVVAGGLLPVGYEIFRMGYYGLLVPGTALAKDAAGDKWSQGMIYLANFDQPYALWLPVLLLVPLGVLLMVVRRRPSFVRPMESAQLRPAGPGRAKPAGRGGLCSGQRAAAGVLLDPPRRRLHARPGVAGATVLFTGSGGRHTDPDPGPHGLRVIRRRPATGWPAPPACSGWASRGGRCGRRTHRAWATTPPASPTPGSSTSAASMPRPPGTHIR